MGTDSFGRDIFSRVMKGTWTTFSIGLFTVLIGAVCGTVVGALTGYFGGIVDDILMRITDALTAFPSILLALVVISVVDPGSKMGIVVALGLVFIPSFARVSRTAFAALRDVNWDLRAYVEPLSDIPYLLSVLALSALCSVAADIMVNYAAARMSVFKVSSFGALSTLCSTFAGVILLREPINLTLLLGAVLILVGIRQVVKK
jgi:ABC-type dipeptide/oligopeptide/nickel transport system permease subunit